MMGFVYTTALQWSRLVFYDDSNRHGTTALDSSQHGYSLSHGSPWPAAHPCYVWPVKVGTRKSQVEVKSAPLNVVRTNHTVNC